jgi:hypothetical protein
LSLLKRKTSREDTAWKQNTGRFVSLLRLKPMAGVTHFLIVAVEKYQNKPFTNVAYAYKDADGIADAFKLLGYDHDNFTILINEAATKSAIEYNLKTIALRTQENDRIIIFFAGHGFAVNGNNVIAPVDARFDGLEDTCVSINYILGWLKKGGSKRNLLFLDCCHSGFEPGEYIRDVTADFILEDLAYKLKDEEYCVGFASCKSHQKSNSHAKLQHGVWSHFLIQALSAEAEEIYEDGCLLSDQLQTFLRNKTYDFVKKNTDDRREQVPIIFGSFTNRFIIEDLNHVFEARETERKAKQINLSSITIYDLEDGKIKYLPGFDKRFHSVPEGYGPRYDSFIKNVSSGLAAREIEELSQKIKIALEYTRKEMDLSWSNGLGTIETSDFIYNVEVMQNDQNNSEYIVKRTLDILNQEIIENNAFNKVFSGHFRHLSFNFKGKINIDEFIDRIEPLAKAKKFKIDYNPADTSKCTIIFPDSVNEIVVESSSINITIPKAASPKELIQEYKATALLLDKAKLNLIKG